MLLRHKGFTLIELLVVIAIISILAVIGFATFGNSQSSTKDARRKADVNSIAKAYETNINPTTGEYQTLTDNQFNGGTKPTPPEGGNYIIVSGPDATTPSKTDFKVCTVLEGGNAATCNATDVAAKCYCQQSSQGLASGTIPSPPVTPSPTPSPTPSGPKPFTADANTVGLWHFDEASGTTAADSSGNNFTGTATNTAVVAGMFSNARNYPANAVVDVANDTKFNLASLTIEAWIKTNTLSGEQFILSRYCWSCGIGYALDLNNNRLIMKLYNGTRYEPTSTTTITTGQWYYVAGTFDGTNAKLYINGTQVYTGTASLGQWNGNLQIGKPSDGSCCRFNGVIDEVRLSAIARTATEISDAYQGL